MKSGWLYDCKTCTKFTTDTHEILSFTQYRIVYQVAYILKQIWFHVEELRPSQNGSPVAGEIFECCFFLKNVFTLGF